MYILIRNFSMAKMTEIMINTVLSNMNFSTSPLQVHKLMTTKTFDGTKLYSISTSFFSE